MRVRAFLTSLALSRATALSSSIPAALSTLALQRPVYTAAPLNLNTSQYQFTLDPSIEINKDFDAVSVDISYYGVPWNSFLYELPLPVSWAERLYAMVEGVDAYELPVILSFAINGNDKKSCPASNASDYPGTTSPGVNDFTGCTQCFDYDIIRNPIASFIRQGFINYALAVSLAFNATGTLAVINFGIDANRYLESGCPAQNWVAFKEFTQQVYASLKEVYPSKAEGGVAIFTSFSLETMMQVQDGQACAGTNWGANNAPGALVACVKAGYAALAGIPYDFFGWSSFPGLVTSSAGAVPKWYLPTALAPLSAAERLAMVVASTGFLSTTLAVNFANTSNYDPPLQCVDLVPSTPVKSDAWFKSVVAACAAPSYRAIIINFRAARDTLFDAAMACPCVAPLPALQPYCNVLEAYRGACFAAGVPPAACELSIKVQGTLGVRDLFGQPRQPLYASLQAARALP